MLPLLSITMCTEQKLTLSELVKFGLFIRGKNVEFDVGAKGTLILDIKMHGMEIVGEIFKEGKLVEAEVRFENRVEWNNQKVILRAGEIIRKDC